MAWLNRHRFDGSGIIRWLLNLIIMSGRCHSQFFPSSLSSTAADQPSSSSSSLASPLMSLISSQNINDLTQFATKFAAQAMKSNGQMIANSGPEVRPIPADARPSEMLGQGLTNMLQPTRRQLAALTLGGGGADGGTTATTAMGDQSAKTFGGADDVDESSSSSFYHRRHPLAVAPPTDTAAAHSAADSTNRALLNLAQTFFGTTSNNNNHGGGREKWRRAGAVGSDYDGSTNDAGDEGQVPHGGGTNGPNGGGGAAHNMIGQAMRMLSGSFDAAASPSDTDGGGAQLALASKPQRQHSGGTTMMQMMPTTLRQLFPGAEQNFGFRQGEGCVPFIGEFMKMAYGNCVKRADEKTWDAWGKEINNALSGGKIDLLRASKETCKMGAEREQCGQLRRAISECDILGSIQLASNLQRSVSRCDEISGLMDQNPGTILNQMNGLINGEVAQGLINNFLG